MFWSALMQLLSPIVFRHVDVHGNLVHARRIIVAAAICTALLAAGGALIAQFFGHSLAVLFVGPQFLSMVEYWPAMLVVAGVSGAGNVLSVYCMLKHRTELLIFPRVAAAFAAISLVLVLVPRMGLAGAVIAAGGAACVLCTLNARLLIRDANLT
jgi:O-antigen/teichoic acid export membrane protein